MTSLATLFLANRISNLQKEKNYEETIFCRSPNVDNFDMIELLGKAEDGSEFIVVETSYTRKKTGGAQ